MTQTKRPRLIDRLWFRLLLAAWVIGIVAYYYLLQSARLHEIAK